jgi:hypothetical protein
MVNKIACILIKGPKEETQDVGYRIFLFTKLDGYGLKVAKPLNIPGGGLKIVVKGDENVIKAAVEDLMPEKKEAITAGAPVPFQGHMSVSFEFGNYDFVEFDDRELQILTLNQLSKCIPAIISMDKEVRDLNQNIGKTPADDTMIKTVDIGLNGKYHTISLTLKAQLIVSLLILLAAVYALFFLLK